MTGDVAVWRESPIRAVIRRWLATDRPGLITGEVKAEYDAMTRRISASVSLPGRIPEATSVTPASDR